MSLKEHVIDDGVGMFPPESQFYGTSHAQGESEPPLKASMIQVALTVKVSYNGHISFCLIISALGHEVFSKCYDLSGNNSSLYVSVPVDANLSDLKLTVAASDDKGTNLVGGLRGFYLASG
ncbi:hypothetical protein E8P77_33370 [Soehngenia saccharolytica]|nr:hypothetical protein E8P77_33370 [Soehngenia saccharolytica]